MGNFYGVYSKPEVYPAMDSEPTFDPMQGFDNRPVRVMKVSTAEMQSAKLPIEDRDYCAHLLINYRNCRADVWPFAYKCHHEKHAYMNCEYEDYVYRMKEYERERRLRERAQKQQTDELANC